MKTIATEYTGPVTLNNRSIQTGLKFLKGEYAGQPIEKSALKDLFNFLESYILSNQILFDGTVPPDQVQKTVDDSAVLYKKGWLWKKNKYEIKPIEIKTPEKILKLSTDTICEASQLLLNIPKKFDSKNSDSLPESDADAFCDVFKKAKDLDYGKRKEFATEIIHENKFIGSKCAAGILSSNLEGGKFYKEISSLVLSTKDHKSHKAILSSELVNRFRANFVNAMSASYGSAYLAHPSVEGLKTQQTMLLWRYLGKKLQSGGTASIQGELQKQVVSEMDSFPYAFALIMHPEVDSIESLLEKADDLRDANFNQLSLSEDGVNKRYIHEMNQSDFERLEDKLFSKTFMKIRSYDSPYKDFLYKSKSFQIPALIGASTALSSVMFEDTLEAAAFELSLMAGIKGASLGIQKYQQKRKLNIYRDHFNKWKFLTNEAVKTNCMGISLESRLQEIFNISSIKG